ncbi:gamma-glutamyltransferase [Chelativorans sp. AA-79]|uniref:gamma-glutamyltransferase family protein n=1 Tax=Chelativorans sp. AA-79 TaxID=3028735 RepID=UPI0023F7C7C4|nr:gamma-glutamyltransferase [Chelativorans sp. AA-79]WEX09139.1 gamma-glutamyltransferase [Chelativorans sp. AA-79]
MNNFSTTQMVRKEVIPTAGGVVAAQHKLAAIAGAEVLRAGGDAVDAAIATSFAIGVVEPWMSGPLGGGMMMVWRANEGQAHTVQFGMRAPSGLRLEDYPLDPSGKASDLFPWTKVKDDCNIFGGTAVAVPGTVDGMSVAHAHFGRMPWRELLQPGIALARKGMLIDWYASLIIASATRQLSRDPDAADLFLIDGKWPNVSGWTTLSQARLNQERMADTLDRLAQAGGRDFYDGDVAAAMVKDLNAKGSRIERDDFARYRAGFIPTISSTYRGGTVHAPGGLSAGPDLAYTLSLMENGFSPGGEPDAKSYSVLADSLTKAYRRRFANAGDTAHPANAPTSTTHFSVVDRHGNMVAVTQTLLSIFGSHIVSPSTGFLANNGIMWFDPEPGKVNSLMPGKQCLMNVCPTIGEKNGRRFAIGASGGRKIMPAVANLLSFLMDYDMSLEDAFHHPRIDNSGAGLVVADENLPVDVLEELARQCPMQTAKRSVFPYAFAVPAGVMREGVSNSGCTEIMTPWGDAAHEMS